MTTCEARFQLTVLESDVVCPHGSKYLLDVFEVV